MTADPLGYIDGPNLFAYVKNNPINHIDPLGLSAKGKAVKEVFNAIVGKAKRAPDGRLIIGKSKVKMPGNAKPGKNYTHTGSKTGKRYKMKFTEDGFPDWGKNVREKAEIDMVGDSSDFGKANAAMREKYGKDWKQPEGTTWHHKEDLKTMELVPSELHGEVRHTGGVAIIKAAKEQNLVKKVGIGVLLVLAGHTTSVAQEGGSVGDYVEAVAKDAYQYTPLSDLQDTAKAGVDTVKTTKAVGGAVRSKMREARTRAKMYQKVGIQSQVDLMLKRRENRAKKR